MSPGDGSVLRVGMHDATERIAIFSQATGFESAACMVGCMLEVLIGPDVANRLFSKTAGVNVFTSNACDGADTIGSAPLQRLW